MLSDNHPLLASPDAARISLAPLRRRLSLLVLQLPVLYLALHVHQKGRQLTTLFAEKEKAKLIARSGIEIAISQLMIFSEQEKKEDKKPQQPVVKKEETSQYYLFYCINDQKEDILIKNYSRQFDDNKEKSNQFSTRSLVPLLAPAILKNTSLTPSLKPWRFSRTANNIPKRLVSNPVEER